MRPICLRYDVRMSYFFKNGENIRKLIKNIIKTIKII